MEQDTTKKSGFRWRDVSNWTALGGLVLFVTGLILKGAGVWGQTLSVWDLFTGTMGIRAFFLPVDLATIVKTIRGQ